MNIQQVIIQKTLRIPQIQGKPGAGGAFARQLDGTLMSIGFKLSGEAFQYFAALSPDSIEKMSKDILKAIQVLVGAHVQHNVYFKDFPQNVPDTEEFWIACIEDALRNEKTSELIATQLASGLVNLLDLPKYGQYQHAYEEMVARHDEFIPSLKDRMTILHLGEAFTKERHNLYLQIAGSKIPANAEDRKLLEELTRICVTEGQPESIPVRENRAIINAVRIGLEQSLIVDTVTDVLRLACHLSGGDVTLTEKTKFQSFPRAHRRMIMKTLNGIASPQKLRDVLLYPEEWKRLGERLKPHEYQAYGRAQTVFAIARGEEKSIRSQASLIEASFANQQAKIALQFLAQSPGAALRTLNRLLLAGVSPEDVTAALYGKMDQVSSRVLLAVREYLMNRIQTQGRRIFANAKGKVFVEETVTLPVLNKETVDFLCAWIDTEIIKRLPKVQTVCFDPIILQTAIPLSNKNVGNGLGILPRGSLMPVTSEHLRFFVYWKEQSIRTDYDLSTLFLAADFTDAGQVSWTNLRDYNVAHSGDITSAPEGAFESIDIPLSKIKASYIVPQVNIYSGEDFLTTEESFFGYMSREAIQKGLPFEPRTVRMKSSMRGKGKVALPIVFIKRADGQWFAKWLCLYLNGHTTMNRVEGNRVTTSMIIKAIVQRQYLTFSYLMRICAENGIRISLYDRQSIADMNTGQSYYLGLSRPDGLPKETTVITPDTFSEFLTT